MKKHAELTASQIRYLIAIKRLYERQGSVRGADIARELKVSKASVHRMMDFFEQVQYVKRDCGKHIVLTDDGMGKALEYEKYSMELNKRLFHSKLCDSIEEMAICFFWQVFLQTNLPVSFRRKQDLKRWIGLIIYIILTQPDMMFFRESGCFIIIFMQRNPRWGFVKLQVKIF